MNVNPIQAVINHQACMHLVKGKYQMLLDLILMQLRASSAYVKKMSTM